MSQENGEGVPSYASNEGQEMADDSSIVKSDQSTTASTSPSAKKWSAVDSWLCADASNTALSPTENGDTPPLLALESDSSDETKGSRNRDELAAAQHDSEPKIGVTSMPMEESEGIEKTVDDSFLPPPKLGLQTEASPVEMEKRRSVRKFMKKIRRERKSKEIEARVQGTSSAVLSEVAKLSSMIEKRGKRDRPPMSPKNGSQHSRGGRSLKGRLSGMGSRSASPFKRFGNSKSDTYSSATTDDDNEPRSRSLGALKTKGKKKKFSKKAAKRFVSNQRKTFRNRPSSNSPKQSKKKDSNIQKFREAYMEPGDNDTDWEQAKGDLINMSPVEIRKLLKPQPQQQPQQTSSRAVESTSSSPSSHHSELGRPDGSREMRTSSATTSVDTIEMTHVDAHQASPNVSILRRSTYRAPHVPTDSGASSTDKMDAISPRTPRSFKADEEEISRVLMSFSSGASSSTGTSGGTSGVTSGIPSGTTSGSHASTDGGPSITEGEEETETSFTDNSLDVSSSSSTANTGSGSLSTSSSSFTDNSTSDGDDSVSLREDIGGLVTTNVRHPTGAAERSAARSLAPSLEASLDRLSFATTSDTEESGMVDDMDELKSRGTQQSSYFWDNACACNAFNKQARTHETSTCHTGPRRTTLDVLKAVFGMSGKQRERVPHHGVRTELPDTVSDITSYSYSGDMADDEANSLN